MDTCPLCSSLKFFEFQGADFFKCSDCGLIFKDFRSRLNLQEEKDRYGLHENNIDDERYVKFLWPVVEELKKHVPSPATGLDYGSGPTPVLAELLRRENYDTLAYDPFFSPIDLQNISNLDFVVSTEAVEHFYSPGKEFQKIFKLLSPKGALIVKTEFFKPGMNMNQWHYPRDPTHVCFFSEESLKWVANKYSRSVAFPLPSIGVFTAV